MADKVMTRNVMTPNRFENGLLVKSPMIFLLLPICRIRAIITGEVTPYKMAVKISAFIGLMPITLMSSPISSDKMMTI